MIQYCAFKNVLIDLTLSVLITQEAENKTPCTKEYTEIFGSDGNV